MAKTTAPLFSLSASGTVARAVSFRTTAGRQVAQAPKLRPSPKSEALAAAQASWRNACQHWYALEPAHRQAWMNTAAQFSLPPLALWCREWTDQRATPTTPPHLPVYP